MGQSKPYYNRVWSKEVRVFCTEQYYLNRECLETVEHLFWEKFYDQKGLKRELCPHPEQILAWVTNPRGKRIEYDIKNPQPNVSRKSKSSELQGTYWGRKAGENGTLRSESADTEEQQQPIKWKLRDIKWSGPRPVHVKEEIVKKEYPFCNYRYYEPVEEEVKLDKKQVRQQKFEEKVKELINFLEVPEHGPRASEFDSLRAELQRRAVNGLLDAHRATLADHVARALRRGKDAERKAAAAITPLLALQISEDVTEQFVREVRPALTAAATDKSASLDTRIECCSSLAVLCYLMKSDLIEILGLMRMYETIFSGSYLEDDGSVKVSGAAVEEASLHAAALDGWALLFPLLPPYHALLSLFKKQTPSIGRLGELLEAVSVEVRMAAGAALAIAYETVTDDDADNALCAHVDELLPRLSELARDSHKFRAKRDRKIQRATFRDILKYFEEGSVPSMSVRIGSETASWSSWSGGAAYAALAGALGGALQVLAPRDVRLRAALGLCITLPEEAEPQEKPNKLQRHLQNRATCKDRDFTRSNNREKRSVACTV